MTRGFGCFLRHNTIALLALFLVLGGTSYAAATLISGSQIKPHTIAKNRLTNKAIKQLRGNRGPRGLQGPKGTTGAQGIQGVQGVQGIQGPPGPFPDPLQAGKTVRGNYSIWEHNASSGQFLVEAVSFGFRLAAAPTPHYLNSGAPPTPECPGSFTDPQAAAGHFCAYEASMSNFGTRLTCDPETSGCVFASSNREGLAIAAQVSAAGTAWDIGSWAVTAGSTTQPSYAGLPRGAAFAK